MKKILLAVLIIVFLGFGALALAVPDGEGNEIFALDVGGTFSVTGSTSNLFFLPAPTTTIDTNNLGSSQWSLYLDEPNNKIFISAKESGGTVLTMDFVTGFSTDGIVDPGSTCGASEYSKWNGIAWTCVPDVDTTYTAGDGITLTGSTFSVTSSACSTANDVLTWNGSSWTCSAPTGTTGPIDVSGSVTCTGSNDGILWYSTGFFYGCANGASVQLNTLF